MSARAVEAVDGWRTGGGRIVLAGVLAVAGAVQPTSSGHSVTAAGTARAPGRTHAAARGRRREDTQRTAQTPGGGAQPMADAMRTRSAVGPLFYPGGRHHCTASVVSSAGGDLLVTAAHCIYGSGGYRGGVEFAPGYAGGRAPLGRWRAAAMFVDAQWADFRAADDDVGFIVVRPRQGQTVEQLAGAERLGVGYGPVNRVTVTGYPSDSDSPVRCTRASSSWSAGQMRFDCDGFSGGTSGGPWVTGDGAVIGVIGGYQRGGDFAAISYSPRFGDRVKALYDTAAATRPLHTHRIVESIHHRPSHPFRKTQRHWGGRGDLALRKAMASATPAMVVTAMVTRRSGRRRLCRAPRRSGREMRPST